MLAQLFALATVAVSAAVAAPTKYGDANILTLAANLELLELSLWNQGLSKYSSEFRSTFGGQYLDYIRLHRLQETDHFQVVQSALSEAGGKKVSNCTYVFPTIYDAASFNKQAQVITAVGEAAYLGTAGSFSNQAYAATAATILGVEARQNSLHRMFGGLQFYDGQYQDTPLTPSQAYSLAAPMIKSCPSSNPPLNKNDGGPLTQFPMINATSNGDGTATLKYKSGLASGTAAIIVYQTKSYRASLQTSDSQSAKINLPKVVNGTSFVILSTASSNPFPVPDSSVKGIGALTVD